jgi:hypothetical protein
MPNTDAQTAAGNTFTWSGVEAEVHLFGAGAFTDSLTYMTQITMESDFGSPAGTFDIETAYLLWNDIVGPRHWVNLWVGRLWAPQLTSYGLHSDYLNDTVMPAVSVASLYSSQSAGFTLGQGHTDGAEINGIIGHRFDYSVGWVASSAGAGVTVPNAEDVYAHIGVKSGGVALDGEGKYGPNVPDPRKPWAEKSVTLDLFAYHGLTRADNGTGAVSGVATPTLQNDRFNAVGAVVHAQLDSLVAMAGVQVESHDAPYPGTAATLAPNGTVFPGAPDLTHGTAILQYDELDYVVWPWLVPGVRVEYTRATVENTAATPYDNAELLRVIPGVAILVRPNIRVILTGDLESGKNPPPQGWGPAGGLLAPTGANKFEAEQINATVSVAY